MRQILIVSLLLAAATFAVHGRAVGFDFLYWDDPEYVTENARVRSGLGLDGVAWAFSTGHASNWHPLTWLSHMLDTEIHGLRPAGHHLTSVVLHVLNALLLFGALRAMTRETWPSAFVAALFALHPLNVESVAWVSERKNVLSTTLGLLATWAYVSYARRAGLSRYLLVAALLALGLMAKPMLVTLPLVLLLLDYWPLKRVRIGRSSTGASVSPLRALAEKAPLLALSAASCVATVAAQRAGGAMDVAGRVAPELRVANAVVSYVAYLGKTFWPRDLSPFYPHPDLPGGEPWASWQVAGAAVLLLGITALLLLVVRRPYAIVGWLWYLGTLVPVIGLVQVGGHAMADRYAYVPLIGVFVAIAWGARDLLRLVARSGRTARWVAVPAAAAALAACAALSWSQSAHWRDSEALFRHALAVTPRNPPAHVALADVLQSGGETDEALDHYRRALDLDPDYALAHNSYGLALAGRGRLTEATAHYRRALESVPDYPEAHGNLGIALFELGRVDEGVSHFRAALRARGGAREHYNLGMALGAVGRADESLHHLRRAAELEPGLTEAHYAIGTELATRGLLDEAERALRRTLELDPAMPEAHHALGAVLALGGRVEEAVAHFREAVGLRPDFAAAHAELGVILTTRGELDAAIEHFRRALEIDPGLASARRDLDAALRMKRERGADR